MTYFNLRKRAAEPEPDEDIEEQPEDAEDEQPAVARGPIITGLTGPGRWLTARFSSSTSAAVHLGSLWACLYYGGWIAAGLVVAWLLAVLAFLPREFKDRISAWFERRTSGGTPAGAGAAPAEAPADPLAAVMWTLIADAPGVHLKTVAAALQEAAPEGVREVVDRAAVRAKLGALNIPVRASVRDAAGRVNEGVHRADLEAWEKALPDPSSAPAPGGRSGPGSDALTSDVAERRKGVATPLSRLRGLLSRGVA